MNKKVLGIYISVAMAVVLSAVAVIVAYVSAQSSDEKVFEDNINKVVEMRVSNDNTTFAYGTGCFIDSVGTILTNKHMVFSEILNAQYSVIQVRLPTEEDFVDVEVLRISNDSDLAAVKINRIKTQFFKINANTKDGQEVFTIGNPNGFGLSFSKGNISSKLRNVVYNGTSTQAMQTSLIINEGNSGGPVFNSKGQLLGVVSFRMKDSSMEVLQGVTFAVPGFKIKEFLNTL